MARSVFLDGNEVVPFRGYVTYLWRRHMHIASFMFPYKNRGVHALKNVTEPDLEGVVALTSMM